MSYFYGQVNANNIALEFMRTSASNVRLRSLRGLGVTVPGSNFFGINGGVFAGPEQFPELLSIAVNNNEPVAGLPGGTGVGWGNAIRRGTVRWDGTFNTAGVQVVNTASELFVQNRNLYWAQGGLSMNLEIEDQDTWVNSISDEEPEGIRWLDSAARSGLCYQLTGPILNRRTTAFLIITRTLCTLWEFRQAIKSGIPVVNDGVFLDGGGSTQINCREAQFAGDGRSIPQMIGLTVS